MAPIRLPICPIRASTDTIRLSAGALIVSAGFLIASASSLIAFFGRLILCGKISLGKWRSVRKLEHTISAWPKIVAYPFALCRLSSNLAPK